ncbi:MAG: helicase C-terminal domain-containing protein, partial [Thiobacillus sp.]|nr:helicase C-terminal domain-containing protein [Thiobacillus sp.]
GGKPFMDYQLPHAAISLKQGAGRLIRTETDRGVLMICDTRLADKPYGKLLLNALPAMTRTRKLEVVARFFAAEIMHTSSLEGGGKDERAAVPSGEASG